MCDDFAALFAFECVWSYNERNVRVYLMCCVVQDLFVGGALVGLRNVAIDVRDEDHHAQFHLHVW